MGRKEATVVDRPKRDRSSAAVASRSAPGTLILCPTATKGSGVLEILHALYFLPMSYRVRVEGDSDLSPEEVYVLFRDDALAARIEWSVSTTSYSDQEKLQPASPFSFADVVVYGNTQIPASSELTGSLVVHNLAPRESTAEDRRFTICANSPEALASAILQVTR